MKSNERRPLHSSIVDRDSDVVEPKPFGDRFHQLKVSNGVGAVDFDDQPFEPGDRQLLPQILG